MTKAGGPSGQGGSFAPQGRATPGELNDQVDLCLDDATVHAVLEAVDSYAVILNGQRQILAANPVLLDALALDGPTRCRGLRLGETMECIHAGEGPDGCGSSRACRRCGALLSILATQATGQPSGGECLISLHRDGRWEAREFAVRTSSIVVAGHPLTLLTLRDISALKRRETLERIFIHDLMNSLQGLKGWAEILQGAGADATSVAGHVLDMAGHLTAEVDAQRRLLQAECGELVPDLRRVPCAGVLDALEVALGADVASRLIRMPISPEAGSLRTDPSILCRILSNMVVNALEAMPPGGLARIWFERRAGRPRFVVENPGCMAPEVADRVFQRSFSTKANRGRGLGTYGMKLLGETVLGGVVGFTSNWTEGTRFFIELPGDD
ncbi:MAG: HAMP domain-containing histidine kinase [Geothrix sp.]|uniref:sensor histidine kinase n=1 Tax=Geothrix sp. TaxID=1962974 RepID=UPI0017D81FBC|nr:HAMP domain-containing sensor histidine kinase [Geothrix sp.]NWJ41621.1 HAMP domain-containing histidine kinase [Geothrix sp.]WIL20397.1 MAG: HAMP domain-containing histidine kinase [Geothrix sp.]